MRIEEKTRDQNKSSRWKQERQKRITASVFGDICKATEKCNKTALARRLTTVSNIRTPPILHGQRYESVAIEKYETLTNAKTKKCGLFVSKKYPMLGASPDRLVDDRLLVEVKCPFVAKDREITPCSVPFLKGDGESLVIDERHNYYYQIQGQLVCANREECDLVVYTFKDLKVIKIVRDNNFINEMIKNLLAFYESHFKQVVIDKYLFKDYNLYKF